MSSLLLTRLSKRKTYGKNISTIYTYIICGECIDEKEEEKQDIFKYIGDDILICSNNITLNCRLYLSAIYYYFTIQKMTVEDKKISVAFICLGNMYV